MDLKICTTSRTKRNVIYVIIHLYFAYACLMNYMWRFIFIISVFLVLPIKMRPLFNSLQQYCLVQIMNQGWLKPVHRETWNVVQRVIIFIDSRLATLSLVMWLNYIRKRRAYFDLKCSTRNTHTFYCYLLWHKRKAEVGFKVVKTSFDLTPL